MEIIKAVVWSVVTALIFLLGLNLSIKLKFPQINISKIIKSLKNNKKGISMISTLFLSLAGRIGVGSIAGVALAIYIGGPGTIFWMWVIAIISGSLAYSETLLAIKYKNKEKNIGGPSHYLNKGLNKPLLGNFYSILVIIAYLIGFIPIQSNTIIKALNINNTFLIGLPLSLISFLLIKKGITRITKVTNKLVPLMTIIYVTLTLIVVLINIDKIPNIIKQIIINAFNIKPFLTGFIPVVLIGVQRAIFSNESGIGLGGIAASTSNETNGVKAGYVQVLGIYITTIIICTSTAFLILTFDYNNLIINNPNGIEITKEAFMYHYPNIGNILLIISIVLFSFSTILTGYYYIESSTKYLLKKPKLIIIKVLTPLSVLMGSISSPTIIWSLIDILVGIMALINLYALYKLRNEILKYHKKYDINIL